MKMDSASLPEEIAYLVLSHLLPDSMLVAIESLSGSFSNETYLVCARQPDGVSQKIVVRRYAIFHQYDRGEKARREYRLYEMLFQSSIPVPEPLLLDDTGTMLGSPGIVTRYVDGILDLNPTHPMAWAREIARTLASIHLVSCETFDTSFLLNAHEEVLWFLKDTNEPPDYMAADSKGDEVWNTMHQLLPTLQTVSSSLVHIDYWPGQLLWSDNQIVAVVDWEEVAYGDPGIDVAYCRMNLILSGQADAADEFLRVYEQEVGRRVANLGYWELAASVRPMFHSESWTMEPAIRESFVAFIDNALQRASSSSK